jgi:hypothetical protein
VKLSKKKLLLLGLAAAGTAWQRTAFTPATRDAAG